ncbi:MAG: hypothetical protein EOM90_17440, partial [Alphaproteobacteria bacterium]|nr:hypothetical protein [Alphaproteobacteria bacterium]
MAVTLLGDLNAYDQYIRSGYMEGLTYFINIFNSGSLGTIMLESENTTGTLKHTSYWNDFLTMARRDVTVNTAQTSEKMTKNEHTAFKTFWKSIPQEFTWTAFKTAENETKETVMFRLGRK